MDSELKSTIEVLAERVRIKESEANQLKKVINELCQDANVPIRYPNITESESSAVISRADQFYGLPLNTAIRNYMDRRKAANLGPATATDIFKALKDGGYKFETKNDEVARVVVSNALRKSANVFHKLPTGQYGLLAWYPTAKAPEDDTPKLKAKKKAPKEKPVKTAPAAATTVQEDKEQPKAEPKPEIEPEAEGLDAEKVTAKEIREIILSQPGQFTSNDVANAVKAKFPDKSLPKTKVPNIIFDLKGQDKLKEIAPRSAQKGAIYVKS